jgi:hypothetical protein
VLEALFNWLAIRGGNYGPEGLEKALGGPDPLEGLRMMFQVMARYYSADRMVKRRVHALAALQPDVGQALALREERRRRRIRTLLERIATTRAPWAPARRDELEQLLFAMTSFESFDLLAGPHRSFTEVAPLLGQSACVIVLAE